MTAKKIPLHRLLIFFVLGINTEKINTAKNRLKNCTNF